MTQNGAVTTTQGGELEIGKKIGDLRALFDSKMGELVAVMDDVTMVRRYIMVTLAAVKKNPKLLKCTKSSILMAVIEAMQVGLEPYGILGQAAIVPFENKWTKRLEAVFMPMYQGLIDLAYRSEKVDKIEARVVYNGWDPNDPEDKKLPDEKKGDVYHYQLGDAPYLFHKPNSKHPGWLDAKCITDAYAIAWLSNGQIVREPMPRAEIDKIKASSQAGDSGPWNLEQWFEMMARKSPVKRIYKYIPKSAEMRLAVAKDDSIEAGEPMPMSDIDPDYLTQRAAEATKQKLDDLKAGMGVPTAEEKQEATEKAEAEVVGDTEEPPAEPERAEVPEEGVDTPPEQVGAEEPPEQPGELGPPPAIPEEEQDSNPEPQTQLPLDRGKAYQRINIHWGNRFKELEIELEKKVKDDLLKKYLGIESLKDVDDDRLLLILNSVAGSEDREAVKVWIVNACKSLGIYEG